MCNSITTHILDVAAGRPAAGVKITLEKQGEGGAWQVVGQGTTDDDGRNRALLPAGQLAAGAWRLVFETGPYFEARGITTFYRRVPVEFQDRAARDADPVTGMRAFGTWNQPAGTWSDDGALLLCTADGLARGLDVAGIGQFFVRWRREGLWTARGDVFDIGNTTAAAPNEHRSRLATSAACQTARPTKNGPRRSRYSDVCCVLRIAWITADNG